MYHLYNNSEATDSQLKTTVPITSETFQYSLQHCTTIVHNNLSHTIPTSYNSLVFIFHHPLLNQTFSKSEGPCSNVRATVRPISRFETYNYGSWCLSRALRAGGVCNTKRSILNGMSQDYAQDRRSTRHGGAMGCNVHYAWVVVSACRVKGET